MSIVGDDGNLDIMNLYNPGMNIKEENFNFYFSHLGRRKKNIGDLNAHHSLWGANGNNFSGNSLVDCPDQHSDISLITLASLLPISMPTK